MAYSTYQTECGKRPRLVSIITPCYNEEANVEELYHRVRKVMLASAKYDYEHIFIDNASTDRTVVLLKQLADQDPRVRIIVNARNFGPARSPVYGHFQARGDATIGLVADLQDPPELIPLLLAGWEQGYSMVLGIKRSSEENRAMFQIRKRYYRLVSWFSALQTFENFCGFGLYDRRVIDIIRSFDDRCPDFRGMIADIGLPHKKIYYDQPVRRRGVSKHNFYTLYDIGVPGLINHSKVPLRIMVFAGFAGSVLAFTVAVLYTFYKLFYWKSFSLGIAPLLIGNFFIFSVQLLFLGVIGEYVGAIHTQVQKRPLVVERERINFKDQAPAADYLPEYPQSLRPDQAVPSQTAHLFNRPAHAPQSRPTY